VSYSAYERVRSNPKFHQLVRRRRRFAWVLSTIVLLSWYGFITVVAFKPDWLRIPITHDAALTVGVPLGAAIIVLGWLLTGWYMVRANTEFDALTHEVLTEAAR
jgi:uncharacterized membrane protein (DUF485 family)